jgi:hypothetical protein
VTALAKIAIIGSGDDELIWLERPAQNSKVFGPWKSRVLDEFIGAAFDLEVVDLNGASKHDQLVTNHEGSTKASKLRL